MIDFLNELPLYILVILIVFCISLTIQLLYYFVVYLRVPLYRSRASVLPREELPPVSVIICARNEEENLSQFLPYVLEQEYPCFEVIVVNDCSIDDSDIVLRKLEAKHKHLRVTLIKPDEKFIHGKKLALTIGIKAAKHSHLVLTDADCVPQTPFWLKNLAENFTPNTDVLLGYGGYLGRKGILNRFIRFDTFFIGLQYIGFALMGNPYMGVGRNLAYRKELFFSNKGFAQHNHLLSGDDDLFVHRVANRSNTRVVFSPDAQTRSVPARTFAEWFKQKTRHLTTAPYYRKGVKFWLGLEPLTRVLFWALGVFLAIKFPYPFHYFVMGAMAFRIIVNQIILKMAITKLNEKKLLLISLIYDLFYPFIALTILIHNKVKVKKHRWI